MVKGVVDVASPQHLAQHITIEGWEPVDAAVRVSDATNLIRRLGGRALYGDDDTAILRELIQNGADAVRARRALEGRGDDWGVVRVVSGTDEHGRYIEVRDEGVGMSRNILVYTLLDFGGSLWTSDQLVSELPGLAGHGFDSVGRFGIGFFSAFSGATGWQSLPDVLPTRLTRHEYSRSSTA